MSVPPTSATSSRPSQQSYKTCRMNYELQCSAVAACSAHVDLPDRTSAVRSAAVPLGVSAPRRCRMTQSPQYKQSLSSARLGLTVCAMHDTAAAAAGHVVTKRAMSTGTAIMRIAGAIVSTALHRQLILSALWP